MYLDIAGTWHVRLCVEGKEQEGEIELPGILQAQGFGEDISYHTRWISGLHDREWWKREEYGYGQENGVKAPFLSQPPRHFLGKALYERDVTIREDRDEEWWLYIEAARWKSVLYVDGVRKGSDCSLCTAHQIRCGRLAKGVHRLRIEIDNSMQYPYRPDGHGVSDALGATWNGMVGEMALFTEEELQRRKAQKKAYAEEHPRKLEVKEGKFYVDGRPEYFRGTHFGGDYPLTGYPVTEKEWWTEKMRILKAWGLNFIRCHSYCPVDAAFEAADEEGVYIQAECGMWNHFEEGIPMLDILREETERILRQFGHHPSFVLFSPSNEPSGDWYKVLRDWVKNARAYDERLGYAGRRLYTAQSGWFYDVAPKQVEGVDYLYFHRSAFGPYTGGTIRGPEGWHGRDYSPSLGEVSKPVICHELGQWCAYPDFDVIHSFRGYLRPGNYEVFRENCRANCLLAFNKEFSYLSGRSQLRLYKEDIEANLRTPGLYGFELLDLRDYLGQGTALVGLLDAFWQEKGYVRAGEFGQFCGETVLLAAFPTYVYPSKEQISIPVSICHFGERDMEPCLLRWELRADSRGEKLALEGSLAVPYIPCGEKKFLGVVKPDRERVRNFLQKNGHSMMSFQLILEGVTRNEWKLYGYDREYAQERMPGKEEVLYTRDWQQAKAALQQAGTVVYAPFLSDLCYECPPLSIKNIFWNGQMGPSWGRSLGLMADVEHPLFEWFPTEAEGGWQWEDILARARGFYMQQASLQGLQPILRVIDDWNRNLPLALIWEAKAGQGKLLVVSADLSGSFDSRPAAWALQRALCQYAASSRFEPKGEVRTEDIERSLFPVLRMEKLTEAVVYEKGAEVKNGNALTEANPNTSVCICQQTFPITLTIRLKYGINVEGILYVPEQRDRERAAFPREVEFWVRDMETDQWRCMCRETFRNSSRSQEIRWKQPFVTDRLRMVIRSCYGESGSFDWEEYREGYRLVQKEKSAVAKLAGIHILCSEEAPHNNDIFWEKQQSSATREIEA